MLYYTNKARKTARETIASLHEKLANIPTDGALNLNDIGNLHQLLEILDSELRREIKAHPEQ